MKKKLTHFFGSVLIVYAVCVVGFTLHNTLYVSGDSGEPTTVNNLETVNIESARSGGRSILPSRLLIPSLSIDAEVQHVGVTSKGQMAVPNNFKDVGWYRHGALPGGAGNAVFAGHLDNAVGLAGVFKNLKSINIGDDIYVTDASGDSINFRVTKKELYDYNEPATERIFGSSETANLILITCEGDWDQSIKQYVNRLVVFATLIP
jgi:sortase A